MLKTKKQVNPSYNSATKISLQYFKVRFGIYNDIFPLKFSLVKKYIAFEKHFSILNFAFSRRLYDAKGNQSHGIHTRSPS